MSAANLVVDERRMSDRRASLHLAVPRERRGKVVSSRDAGHIEVFLIEVQCAVDAALTRAGHTIAVQKLLENELRELRAALTAARVAARTATGIVSGVDS